MDKESAEFSSFEDFWPHFLASHQKSSTRWAHIGGVLLPIAGAVRSVYRRSAWPLLAGAGAGLTLIVGAHPLFEGNRPENFGRPIWAARAVLRMCVRTLTGSIQADLAKPSSPEQARSEPQQEGVCA